MEGRYTGKGLVFFAACGVSAAASEAKPAATCHASAHAPALAVSLVKAQYSSLLGARALSCWLWSA